MTKFAKPARDNASLIAQLTARKLQIDHREKVQNYFTHIGYYRLSGYMHPFLKRDGTEDFKDGTHFTMVLDHYLFDKKLRYILLDMCERIEVSVRANICNIMALKNGPHWYMDTAHFRNFDRHQEFLKEAEEY